MIFVGLGNPGREYESTRHNIGQVIVYQLAAKLGLQGEWEENPKLLAYIARDKQVIVALPTTYINESGVSVQKIARWFKDSIIVVHDDVEIPFGEIRIKFGGTSGGHNGIKSIDEQIGTEYWRVRVGIGRNEKIELSDYVLMPFSSQEQVLLPAIIDQVTDKLVEYSLQEIKTETFTIDAKEINKE